MRTLIPRQRQARGEEGEGAEPGTPSGAGRGRLLAFPTKPPRAHITVGFKSGMDERPAIWFGETGLPCGRVVGVATVGGRCVRG